MGTAGVRELESGDDTILLAGFEEPSNEIADHFAELSPEWEQEEPVDWVEQTRRAWPPREVGRRIFLAPHWSDVPTPEGRVRIVHNPGMASGTGEHPCTQLALQALEATLHPGDTVADIGTGSGILAIAAAKLGASIVIAVDTDSDSLQTALENFELNELHANVALGSADCIANGSCNAVVANISGTVLLAIFDELLRILAGGGRLILTGFPEWELATFQKLLPHATVTASNEWRCVVFAS